jgi:hypothetical protein
LLIPRLVVAKIRILLKRLPDARDVAVAKDSEAPGEKTILDAVALDKLVLQECNGGLTYGQPDRFHN